MSITCNLRLGQGETLTKYGHHQPVKGGTTNTALSKLILKFLIPKLCSSLPRYTHMRNDIK